MITANVRCQREKLFFFLEIFRVCKWKPGKQFRFSILDNDRPTKFVGICFGFLISPTCHSSDVIVCCFRLLLLLFFISHNSLNEWQGRCSSQVAKRNFKLPSSYLGVGLTVSKTKRKQNKQLQMK